MGAMPDSSREDIFILFIGDDPIITEIFDKSLKKQLPKKCHFQIVSGYEESLNELDIYNYDFIFLDLFILESGGLLSIKDISARRSNSKIVLLIPEEKKEIAAKGLFAGAYDYLIKEDITVEKLKDLLTRLIETHNVIDVDPTQEELFRNLTETIPGAVLLADLKGKALSISDRTLQLYGAPSREDFIGKTIFDFIVENQRDRAIAEFDQLLSTGYLNNIEYEIIKSDGSQLFINVNGVLLKDSSAKPIGVIFSAWDITNVHSIQKELISSKSLLEQTVEERTIELEKTNEKLKHYINSHRQAEYLTNISYDLALALCTSSSLNDALRLAVDAAILVSKMDCGCIYIRNDEMKTFELAFQRGNSPEFIKQALTYNYESDVVQLMFASKPVYGMFNETGIRMNDILIREGLKASALIPLIYQGQIVGSLIVVSKTLKEVPFITRQSLETIAVQIAGIIARFKAEEISARNEERLRTQFNSIPVPTYIWKKENGELVLKDFNEAANILSQVKLDEWRGIKAIEIIEHNENTYNSFLQCFNEKKNYEQEIQYHFKTTGETKNLLLKMVYVPENQVLLHAMDVTEIRRAEEILKDQSNMLEEKVLQRTSELESAYNDLMNEMMQRQRAEKVLVESENRYRSLIEAKGDLIGEIDLDGNITYISPQVEDVLGFSKGEIIGNMKISDLISQNSDQRIKNFLKKYLSRPVYINAAELSLRKKNGQVLCFEVSVIPIYNDDGILSGLRGLGSDITSKIEAAEKINKIQTSLEKKASELEEMNKEFEHYAYVVSHDLKEPLRTIYSSAEYLKKDLLTILSDRQLKYFEYLSEAVKRSLSYIEGLLTLSRIGRIQKPIEEINMKIFIKGLLNSLNLSEDVNVILPDDLPIIKSELILLQQIFQNLINNAVKFNDSKIKTIEIGWDASGDDSIKFFVKDNGRGIDPSNFEKIFQVFEKVHFKDEDEGMGLGLAIVKKAVTQLKGSVYVESKIGEGSVFYIKLPNNKTREEKRD